MNNLSMSKSELIKQIVTRFGGAILVMPLMFFLPAGTFNYWQAWVCIAIILLPMTFVLRYLYVHDPDLLVRRMRLREKRTEQRSIVYLSYIPFLLAFILPGFDRRYGWSAVPVWLVILSDVLALLGYGLIFMVFRENRYTSRIVEVEKEQTVISSGPYSIVRHPMYLGTMVMYSFTPLALGSWWALIPALMVVPVLVLRILDEEKVLVAELKGYEEYRQKVHYRLIPGIW
jgi:protein-S-isoprenylcysteine O-methyltransferase Ste14